MSSKEFSADLAQQYVQATQGSQPDAAQASRVAKVTMGMLHGRDLEKIDRRVAACHCSQKQGAQGETWEGISARVCWSGQQRLDW